MFMKSNRLDSICLSGMVTSRHGLVSLFYFKDKGRIFGYPSMFG